MAGPVLRVFQTTTHAFNTLTEPNSQSATNYQGGKAKGMSKRGDEGIYSYLPFYNRLTQPSFGAHISDIMYRN